MEDPRKTRTLVKLFGGNQIFGGGGSQGEYCYIKKCNTGYTASV